MKVPRYIATRPTPEPPERFAWDYCYKNRAQRLAELIRINAPEPMIENECHALQKAIARSHNTFWVLLRWARQAFHSWCHLKWFSIQWYFCFHILRWNYERCEKYFFGEYEEQDPEVEQLRQMAGLNGGTKG